jgi:hypothetical protein
MSDKMDQTCKSNHSILGLAQDSNSLNLLGTTYYQWLKAQLVERTLSVMKYPGSNLGAVLLLICDLID